MTKTPLQVRLSQLLGVELELVINQNRSTMLSMLEKRRGWARVSIHQIFLCAPEHVVEAVAHFIRGDRKNRRHHNLILRGFIQEELSNSDFTHLVDEKKLEQQGRIYHLQEFYEQANATYFENKLNLQISWYGRGSSKARSRITFGQYLDGLRLIKIHRMLDDPFFPEYFVRFVVYHEMLHAVVPGEVDGRGRYCFHGPAFKKREKQFEHYYSAIFWEKANKKDIFKHGRSQ